MDVIVGMVAIVMNVFALLDIWLILWLLFGCDMKLEKKNIIIAVSIFVGLNIAGAVFLEKSPDILFAGICIYYIVSTLLLTRSHKMKMTFLVIPAVLVYSQWGSFLNLIDKVTTLNRFYIENSQGESFTIIEFCSDALLCLTLYLLSKTKVAKLKKIQLSIGEGIFLSLFCCLSPAIVVGLEWFEGMVNAPAYKFTWIVFMILLNVAVVYAIVHRKKATYYKHLSEGYKDEFESEYSVFRDYREQQKDTIKFRHDWKNHMLLLQQMLEEEKYDQAQQYFEELTQTTDKHVRKIATGHELLDMIISSKMNRMEEANITFSFTGDVEWFHNMKQVDCCILFSNLLDNATEANEKLEGTRYITVRTRKTEGSFYCELRNPLVGELLRKDDVIVTTKEDKEKHGIGLQNVYEIIEKYQGQYLITTEKNEYIFQMVFSV